MEEPVNSGQSAAQGKGAAVVRPAGNPAHWAAPCPWYAQPCFLFANTARLALHLGYKVVRSHASVEALGIRKLCDIAGTRIEGSSVRGAANIKPWAGASLRRLGSVESEDLSQETSLGTNRSRGDCRLSQSIGEVQEGRILQWSIVAPSDSAMPDPEMAVAGAGTQDDAVGESGSAAVVVQYPVM